MEIRFNVTGERRKALVAAITEVLNTPQKYLGAPTFAYEIGNCKIDKTGTLTGEVAQELLDTLSAKGFEADIERRSYQAELYDPETPDRMEIFSADDDEDALRQAYEYTDENVRLLELHELDDRYDIVRSVDIPRTPDRLVLEMPLEGFSEAALDNLEKLVISKAALIKKSVGAFELPITRTETTLQFPWFTFGLEPEKVDAYSRFIAALCAMAKEQKRITAKEKPVDNEKYAFRCFLLRLGFIGEEYAASRKILLAGLSGNSSFKSGERKQPDTVATVADTGATDDLAEALADEELIHGVNALLGDTSEVAI